jgi:prolyl-tRNA synthetase
MYAEWVQSYRDLPILINQWANVMRWEKRTRPFLRTMEFLWQEGHTAHATETEAAAEVAQMLEIYREVAEGVAGVPVVTGEKSSSERFAGADHTYSIEALMPDGKALQAGTSHELGQNFARAYDISFAGRDQTQQYAWTTSWGMSWRMLGALIMVHGDDQGLRIPPKMAPIEVVIVPITRGESTRTLDFARELQTQLAPTFRVKLDDRDLRPGNKYADWDLRGVPLRIVIGERDLDAGQVTLVRRDYPPKTTGREIAVPLAAIASTMRDLLVDIQANLYTQAQTFLRAHTFAPATHEEFMTLAKSRAGMLDIPWCDRAACEAAIKDQTSATTRNLRTPAAGPVCLACGEPARVQAYIAQSY